MSGKTLLIRDKDLSSWWVSIAHDPRFDQVLGHVRAELCEADLQSDSLRGANHALALLQTITDNQTGFNHVPSPGLDHRTPEQILKSKTERK